jgi:3-hydroxyacyl-CoA dehydrogenase/enoyl-CoA hydratase/3-hydroxybutyryl-CoA epimerase
LIDEIGVDVTVDIATTLEKAYGRRDRAPRILKLMRESKLLGRKGGGGFYKYEGRGQSPNKSLTQWRQSGSAKNDVDPAAVAALAEEAFTNRLMFLMINEAARCIEEKVVESEEDADVGMVLGSGFAPDRGGPLRFAEHFGLKKVVEEMNRLAQSDEKFVPCDILKKHVREGTKFYES